MNIEFSYKKIHLIENVGYIKYTPSIPREKGLYVIYNASTEKKYYIGTSSDIQKRFDSRARSVQELGFNNNEIQGIKIYIVKTKLNGQSKLPGDQGTLENGLDVEWLLIRSYLQKGQVYVRNANKINNFVNATGENLSVSFTTVIDNSLLPAIANFTIEEGCTL